MNRSNNRDCSLSAHLFLSFTIYYKYHDIIPLRVWPDTPIMAGSEPGHFVTGKTPKILNKIVGYWLPVIGHPAQAKFLSYKKLVLQVFGLTTKKAESCYIVIFCNIIRIRDSDYNILNIPVHSCTDGICCCCLRSQNW